MLPFDVAHINHVASNQPMSVQQPQQTVSVKEHIDTLGQQHPRTAIMPLTEKEPKVFQIMRAKQKQASLQKASALTTHDSVKLNLIQLYPTSLDLFGDNALTRILHPADTLKQSAKTISESRPLQAETIQHFSLSDTATLPADSLKINTRNELTISVPSITLHEKPKPVSGLHREMGWLIPVVLILVFFAGIVKSFSGKYINNLFKSVFNQQNADNLYQMVNLRNSLPSLSLDLLFVLNVGLFAFLSLKTAGLEIGGIPSPLQYLILCGALLVLMVLKTSIYKFLSYVFALSAHTSEFIFYVFLYTRTLSLALLPITVGMAFADSLLSFILMQTGLVMLVAMYLMQLLRGIKIFLRNLTAIFYLFLYLCALEILPILVVLKIITH